MAKTVKKAEHGNRKTKEEVNEHGLTSLQEQFCQAYLVRFNITWAENELGLSKGTGNKWMQDIKVRERITAIRVESGKAFNVTRERLLQELANVIYADIRRIEGDDVVQWPDEEIAAIASVEFDAFGMGVVKKITRWDKLKAIDTLNKMLGYNMPDVTKIIPGNAEPMDKNEVIEIAKQLKDVI